MVPIVYKITVQFQLVWLFLWFHTAVCSEECLYIFLYLITLIREKNDSNNSYIEDFPTIFFALNSIRWLAFQFYEIM